MLPGGIGYEMNTFPKTQPMYVKIYADIREKRTPTNTKLSLMSYMLRCLEGSVLTSIIYF
jgi:hypothetical protein